MDGDDKSITTGYIAASITDYMAKQHPNEKIMYIDYVHKNIDVNLTNKIDLEFNRDGSFLKVD